MVSIGNEIVTLPSVYVPKFHEDLKSIWFFVDVSEGLVVIFEGFVLLLGELFHSSVPFSFYFVESSIDFSFGFSLFASVVILLFAFPFVFGDFPAG